MSSNTNRDERPRYRVTASKTVYIEGCLRSPGAEFESIGWPPDVGVEPANAQAELVVQFKKDHFWHPVCGERTSPFARKYGTIFLPHIGTEPVDPASVPATAPRYTAPHGAEFQTGYIAPREEFVFLNWPAPEWKAENSTARQVMAWLEQHGGDARTEPSPWNGYDESLVLPDLPPVKDPRMAGTPARPYETSPYQKEIERHINKPRGRRRTAAA